MRIKEIIKGFLLKLKGRNDMAIKGLKLMADFETTVDPNDVRVWAVCAVNIDNDKIEYIGDSLEGFMDWLSKGKNSKVWFHNLRFDGEWVLHYLLTNGYKYNRGVDKAGNKVALKEKEFTCLITDDGLFYSIDVVFKRGNKKLEKVTFYDSLKKLPLTVRQIAKAYELPISKGEIDYKADRPRGYQMTEKEREYIVTDCRIVSKALKMQFDEGMSKMTSSSDAMAWYKASIGKSEFENWFPVLPIYLDDAFRKAYRGGYVYLNPKYKNARVQSGEQYDVNSLYPDTMYHKLLPYGYPHYFTGKPKPSEKYPLYFVHLKTHFKLKEGHLPTIQLKNTGRFGDTEYLTTSHTKSKYIFDDKPVELFMTSIDYELMLDHYELEEPEYIDGYEFQGAHDMFKSYIDYWMEIKANSTGGKRQLAKNMLNSLYGKFASKTVGKVKIPYLDEDGIVRYTYSEDEYRDPIYTPMACFITAYAREKTIRAAQSVYDRFIYSDTDSLKIAGFGHPEGLEIHKSNLGAWKHEGSFTDSKWIRAKTYMVSFDEECENTLKNFSRLICNPFVYDIDTSGEKLVYKRREVTCAGMPDNVKEYVDYDNFVPGQEFYGKLMPKRYKGGIILEETTFTIGK